MNVAGINFESVADGDGVRVVIYISGCLHGCKGCHNQATWSFTAGQPFSENLLDDIIKYIKQTPFISGVTLSGGDPLYSVPEITEFIMKLKQSLPEITIWLYTGFIFEDIIRDKEQRALLELCDVLVDGEFILEQRDMTLCYKGSRNQHIIDVKQSLLRNEAVELFY